MPKAHNLHNFFLPFSNRNTNFLLKPRISAFLFLLPLLVYVKYFCDQHERLVSTGKNLIIDLDKKNLKKH
jgi:hypothetical protein